MKMDIFSDDFLGDVLIMIIGLVVLGIGAQLIIAGAYVTSVNYFMTIILVVVGAFLVWYGIDILRDLIKRIDSRKNTSQ